MAAGDIIWFEQFYLDVGLEIHQLETDVFKVGLIDNSVTPAVDTADPRWGAGGTTNFSTTQVTPGGNYADGGPAIASNTYTLAAGEATLDGDDISILQDGSNPADARWGIIYNDTTTGKQAVGAVDLGSVRDLTSGDFSIEWNVDGIMVMAAEAA
jgi:hypothetical protein